MEKEPKLIKPITSKVEAPKSERVPKGVINHVATTQKIMALTFNGLADEQTMDKLLNELNRFDIKATFFLPGIRVAEDPDLAKEIIKQGHTIQNNTLNHVLPDKLKYEEAYIELALANRVFKEHLNIEPKYARTRSGDSSDSFQEAAAQLNMEVVTYTINPKDTQMQSAEEIADYIRRFANRGAIIELNTYINPEVIRAIPLIYQYASADGYTLTTLEEVHQTNYLVDELVDTNNLAVNTDYKNSRPAIIEKFSTLEKEIALTFDDWASDETITAVLDILDNYNVKSTFFLIGKGVETNPQLARLIIERGHEVASHSYNHKVITTMNPRALQEDLVKNDQILTHALQIKPLNYFRPAQG
ncbi:polysaccharide deacetylase family protein, partial [Streptomyces diastaticus]